MFRVRSKGDYQSLIRALGWRFFFVSIILSVPAVVWWMLDVGECTQNTQIRVAEALGVVLMALAIPIVPILVIMVLFVTTLYVSVRVVFLAEGRVRAKITLFYVFLAVNSALQLYYQNVCASVETLIAQTAALIIMFAIAIGLMRFRADGSQLVRS